MKTAAIFALVGLIAVLVNLKVNEPQPIPCNRDMYKKLYFKYSKMVNDTNLHKWCIKIQ